MKLRNLIALIAPLIVAASSLLAPTPSTSVGLITTAGSRYAQSSGGGGVPTTAAEDWTLRTSGAGVVWFHDFCSSAEVDQFRWSNDFGADPGDTFDPGLTVWVSDDGTTCGSLESRHPVGTNNPPDWWRPMAPLNAASNGRGVDDPAANGTLTLRSFSPTSGGDELLDLNNVGQYGPSAYHGDASYNGTTFWLQMRVKISANRCCVGSGPSGDEGGKILYFTNTRRSNSDQEIVTNSFYAVNLFGADNNLFQMYRSGGTGLVDDDPTNARQVGGEYNGGVCTSSPLDASGCWFWPTDEVTEGDGHFVTILYEIIPGTDGGDDTIVRTWKAEWGETSYTKIWDQSDVDIGYDPDMPRGYNAIILSGYQNDIIFDAEIWHRYDQLIFSHSWIPPPQFYESSSDIDDTVLGVACNNLGSGDSTSFPSGTLHNLGSPSGATAEQRIEWQARFFFDPAHKLLRLFGKSAANEGGPTDWRLRTYDIVSDTWSNDDALLNSFNRAGHVYASFDVDPATGDIWAIPGSDPDDAWKLTYAAGTWAQVAADIMNGGNDPNGPNAGAWHPNLYGIGNGGFVMAPQTHGVDHSLSYIRGSNNALEVDTDIDVALGTTSAQGFYFEAVDAVVIGRTQHVLVHPNGGSTPTFTLGGTPPIQTMGTSSGTSHAVMLQHPGNPLKALFIEKYGSKTYRTSTDGVNWGSSLGTHPITGSTSNPYSIATLYPDLPCTLSIGVSGGTLNSILWRPAP